MWGFEIVGFKRWTDHSLRNPNRQIQRNFHSKKRHFLLIRYCVLFVFFVSMLETVNFLKLSGEFFGLSGEFFLSGEFLGDSKIHQLTGRLTMDRQCTISTFGGKNVNCICSSEFGMILLCGSNAQKRNHCGSEVWRVVSFLAGTDSFNTTI